MKIAIPVKTKKENPAVAPLFGKAKYFAIIKDNQIQIEENPFKSGAEVVKWLYSMGVDTLIIQEMGHRPYEMIQQLGIKVYFAGKERIELKDVLQKFQENKLERIDENKMAEIIKHHESKHHH